MNKKKKCKKCKRMLDSKKDFYISKKKNNKVYYRGECKKCKKKYETRKNQELREWMKEYKEKLFCNVCGFSDKRALQFHHKNSNNKHKDVSVMVGDNYSKEKILKEIDKCEVLCANCHLIHHYSD